MAAGDRGAVAEVAIPQLAGHLLVLLVEAFAVVGEQAAAHFVATAQPHLLPPIGVGEALPRGGDEALCALARAIPIFIKGETA